MTREHERLERLLGGQALQGLRMRLRRRFEQGRTGDVLVLSGLRPEERAALEGLLGRRAQGASSLRFSLRELDDVFQNARLAGSLREALELLEGPIRNLSGERAASERSWEVVFSGASASSALLAHWLSSSVARGLVKRISRASPVRATALLSSSMRVLERLPVKGVPRSQLSAEVLGDAHGLDAGKPVTTIALAALRAKLEAEEPQQAPGDPERDRDTWARAGVLVNELASPALVLNLAAEAHTQTGALLSLACTQGTPLHLSLRALARTETRFCVEGRTVFVCENANVVAIVADRLGVCSRPLVCTDGMPSASQRTLLEQLAAQGARLLYHGDFDWPGVRIANYVLRTFGASPWRMSVRDYLGRSGRELTGGAVDATWDADLSRAMLQAGYVLEEEAVVSALCEDLAAADGSP